MRRYFAHLGDDGFPIDWSYYVEEPGQSPPWAFSGYARLDAKTDEEAAGEVREMRRRYWELNS